MMNQPSDIAQELGTSVARKQRGMNFEAAFYKQLHQVTTKIHNTENLEQIMLEASQSICKLLHAERLTLYTLTEDGNSITSKIKTGLNTSSELRLPISPQSIAGYAAFSKTTVNIPDVYDQDTLRRIHPSLRFLKAVDKRSGYRTQQMIAAPILEGHTLYGVLQLINNQNNVPFGDLEMDGVFELCKTLAVAIRQRQKRAEHLALRKLTPYDPLVSAGLLAEGDLQQLSLEAKTEGQPLEPLLLARTGLLPSQIGASLAQFFGVPYEPFHTGRFRSEALHGVLKREFLAKQGWIPLEESDKGLVIMCTDPEAVKSSRITHQVFPRIAAFAYRVTTHTEFTHTLSQLFGTPTDEHSIDQLLAGMDQESAHDESNDELLINAAADNELVKFVNKVIVDAYHQHASDIHIEPMPGKQKTGIRFRIDGSLIPYIEVPAYLREAMVTRLKIMCDLDISERRKPQDGKIKFKKYGPLDIELRVATIPSAGGVEDLVLRILSSGEPISLDKLGLTAHNRARLETAVRKPFGLFYVCGPTGSGKTTTLHSILKHLNTPDTKIWTAEDPIEITQKGLRQVQINRKAGIDFAMLMRAFLRADPDIIMVGESRDKETVSMGVEASLTGHMVFSTLHTNSAPESISRLLDMGMDPFNFADALVGILAQRLVKKLCDCKQAYVPDEPALALFVAEYAEELRHTRAWRDNYAPQAHSTIRHWASTYGERGQITLYRPMGCDACKGTGYKGRIGLHELMVVDAAVKQGIQSRARVADLLAAAVEAGMRTLKMDGMEKVLMGWTDLKMVRAVCAA